MPRRACATFTTDPLIKRTLVGPGAGRQRVARVMTMKPHTNTTSASAPDSVAAPLYVDLDGTLLRTDMLLECAVRFVCRHPWKSFVLLAWALRGPAHLKFKLAEYLEQDAATLPWNQ